MEKIEGKAHPMYGLPNYLPPRKEGEDEVSIKKHVKWMRDERRARKKRPDTAQLDRRMGLTFADRRDKVVSQNVSVDALIEEYPWLQDFDEVSSIQCMDVYKFWD